MTKKTTKQFNYKKKEGKSRKALYNRAYLKKDNKKRIQEMENFY